MKQVSVTTTHPLDFAERAVVLPRQDADQNGPCSAVGVDAGVHMGLVGGEVLDVVHNHAQIVDGKERKCRFRAAHVLFKFGCCQADDVCEYCVEDWPSGRVKRMTKKSAVGNIISGRLLVVRINVVQPELRLISKATLEQLNAISGSQSFVHTHVKSLQYGMHQALQIGGCCPQCCFHRSWIEAKGPVPGQRGKYRRPLHLESIMWFKMQAHLRNANAAAAVTVVV